MHCLPSFVTKSGQSGSRTKNFRPTPFVVASKGIKREPSIEFLVKFQSRRPPQSKIREKKALALINGLSVFTEDRGLNRESPVHVDEPALGHL